MQGKFVWPVLAVALTWTANANADSPNLKGDYAFTGSGACLISAPLANGTGGGFNARLQPNPGSRVWSHSLSVEGIRSFNGDGTGTVKGTGLGIIPPPTPGANNNPPIPPFSLAGQFPPSGEAHDFSFAFTYTVNGDGSFSTQLVPGSFAGMQTAGPRSGQTFTADVLTLVGLIANGAKSLTLASVVPEVQTIVFNNGDRHPQICHRSRVLLKLDNDDGNGR